MRRILLFVVLVALVLEPATALAFNKAAHMVSGAIAYHVLKLDSR